MEWVKVGKVGRVCDRSGSIFSLCDKKCVHLFCMVDVVIEHKTIMWGERG